MNHPPKPSADHAGASRLGREQDRVPIVVPVHLEEPRRRKRIATGKGKKKVKGRKT